MSLSSLPLSCLLRRRRGTKERRGGGLG